MRLLLIAVVVFIASLVLFAQEGSSTPTLTELQKLQVLVAAKDVEIMELRTQQARDNLQKVIALVTPAGYQLNDKLELVKVEAK